MCIWQAKSILDYVAIIIPFYTEASIGVVVFLAFGGGAQMAYGMLRPILKEHEKMIDEKLSEAAEKAKELQAEAKEKGGEYAADAMKMAQNAAMEAMKKSE